MRTETRKASSIPEGEEDTQYDDEYLLVDADNYVTDVGVDKQWSRGILTNESASLI